MNFGRKKQRIRPFSRGRRNLVDLMQLIRRRSNGHRMLARRKRVDLLQLRPQGRRSRPHGEIVNLVDLLQRRSRYRPWTFRTLFNTESSNNFPNLGSHNNNNMRQDYNYFLENNTQNRTNFRSHDHEDICRESSPSFNIFETPERRDIETNTDIPSCLTLSFPSDERAEVEGNDNVCNNSKESLHSNLMKSLAETSNKESVPKATDFRLGSAARSTISSSISLLTTNPNSKEVINTSSAPLVVGAQNNESIEDEIMNSDFTSTINKESNSCAENTPTEECKEIRVNESNTSLSSESIKINDSAQQHPNAAKEVSLQSIAISDNSYAEPVEALSESSEVPHLSLSTFAAFITIIEPNATANTNNSDSATNNERDETISYDPKAGGDGHHNDAVMQIELTLATAIEEHDVHIESNSEGEETNENT